MTDATNAIEAVYLRRARQLAARPNAAAVSATVAVLVCGIGTERYGIELAALTEVFPYGGCTAIPGCAPALLGVINVRGDIRAVADLRELLELPPAEDRPAGYVVMVRHRDRVIGVRIETVEGVRQIDPAQLTSPAAGAAPIAGARFVKALTADTMILVDTDAALSSLDSAVA